MLRGLLQEPCECGPNANLWIRYTFGDCIYTQWEMAAFIIGLSSMAFWVVAQLPQFITNFINQSAEALSPWFLFQWLGGDTFNLLGCLLTGDQLVTETLTAVYFVFADALIISQYIYYQFQNGDRLNVLDESVHKPSRGYLEVVVDEPAAKLQDLLRRAALPADQTATEHAEVATTVTRSQVGLQTVLQHPALPVQRIDLINQDEKVMDLKKQVRRVISLYGLDYGPPKSSRLSVEQLQRLQGQLSSPSPSLCNGPAQVAKPPVVKALACLAGIFLVGSSRSLRAERSTVLNRLPRRFLLSAPSSTSMSAGISVGRKLLVICGYSSTTVWTHRLGIGMGWVSSALYLGSRVAQLVKNRQRRSAEGLSMGMVRCAMMANVCYGTAILMRAEGWDDLAGKAPWILGSLGTVSLDITIFLQAQYYAKKIGSVPDELTPLLA